METTILLVEDNEELLGINRRTLELEGYRVLEARTLDEAARIIRRGRVQLVVLDIMMPDGSGLDFCRELRQTSAVPVLFLTALGDKHKMLEGLRGGGDDYLAKPYDLDVLLARIAALLRRVRLDRAAPRLAYGMLEVDRYAAKAYVKGADAMLTGKECGILLYLMDHPGEICPLRDIYAAVWQSREGFSPGVVRTHMSALRKKLGLEGEENPGVEIESVFREGYRLTVL